MLLNDTIFEDDADEWEGAEENGDTRSADSEDSLGGKRLHWIYGMQRRMRELLALPAPACGERDYLMELGVPSEKIDNCMILIGVLFKLSVEGNMRAFQELRHMIGDNETYLDRRIKLMNLKKARWQIEDLKRRFDDGDDGDGGEEAHSLAEALEKSAASLWGNGGDGPVHEREEN